MEFPKRTSEHVKESASWKILQAKTPAEWIIREVTERDYGIDAYVELATDAGEVTGELCSLQIKGTDEIEWKSAGDGETQKATLSGIAVSTINYWMHLPVPVFLIWADIKAGRAFFASVKSQVREQYDDFHEQASLGFRFSSVIELGTEIGTLLFKALYFKEKHFRDFQDTLRELMIHCQQYLEFIQEYQGRDVHLGIEDDEQLMLVHLYKACHLAARFLDVKWEVPDIAEVYKRDMEAWKDKHYMLHQHSMAEIMEPLEPVFIAILRKAKKLVMQSPYWRHNDLTLYRYWSTFNLDNLERG